MYRIVFGVYVIMIFLFLAGCVSVAGEEVPFVIIDEGDSYSGFAEQQGVVVYSTEEWEKLWKQVHASIVPTPELPEVDFDQQIIVAVFAGEKPSGGYTVKVDRILQTDEAVTVYVVEDSPEPEEMTITVISYPYQMVKMPYTDLPVDFEF